MINRMVLIIPPASQIALDVAQGYAILSCLASAAVAGQTPCERTRNAHCAQAIQDAEYNTGLTQSISKEAIPS